MKWSNALSSIIFLDRSGQEPGMRPLLLIHESRNHFIIRMVQTSWDMNKLQPQRDPEMFGFWGFLKRGGVGWGSIQFIISSNFWRMNM